MVAQSKPEQQFSFRQADSIVVSPNRFESLCDVDIEPEVFERMMEPFNPSAESDQSQEVESEETRQVKFCKEE